MREKKKGESGIAPNYITRTKAVRKLQISLKDFRRLCILKGVFPRDPKKKAKGKDKTYYHVKDINFLAHEPLLHKFRELKAFLKKYHRAKVRKDPSRAKKLLENKPKYTLDHLVKERYPSFVDAIRDVDDPLTMVHLFAMLPAKVTKHYTADDAATCLRLCREFQHYVYRTHSLRKVFVSIKGIYYQADIAGQPVTWLVPHKFTQSLPSDVDYRVMVTFLQFYMTMLKFLHFKLFHDLGLQYPPELDASRESKGAGLFALRVQTVAEAQAEAERKKAAETAAKELREARAAAKTEKVQQLQKQVDSIVKSLGAKATAGTAVKSESATAANDDVDDFSALEEKKADDDSAAATKDESKPAQDSVARLFSGSRFLLGRETPQDSLEFVILSAGGDVARADDLSAEEIKGGGFKYQVMDRPVLVDAVPGRIYVQPQWVYDSFNTRALLPTDPYRPGVVPPPHLSPFVDNEKEGYVPKQAEVLAKWGAQFHGVDASAEAGVETAAATATADGAMEVDEETRYQQELAKERAGVSFSESQKQQQEKKGKKGKKKAAAPQADEDVDEEEEVVDESDGSDEDVPDSDSDNEGDEDDDEDAALASKVRDELTKQQKKADPNDEKELAKLMMGKKQARLYQRMQHGISAKQTKAQELMAKRLILEEKEKRSTKRGKAATAEVSEDAPVSQPVSKKQKRGAAAKEEEAAPQVDTKPAGQGKKRAAETTKKTPAKRAATKTK